MKIAITGHTAGIGRALSEIYSKQGHDIIGISKREGNNIKNIPKTVGLIEPCDMFINNAQAGYAQTELLFEMAKQWAGTNKQIIVISTMMTQEVSCPIDNLDMDHYRVQKVALEEAVRQLRNKHLKIKLTLVRPGNIATNSSKTVPPAANVDIWANTLLHIFRLVESANLRIDEVSLGPA